MAALRVADDGIVDEIAELGNGNFAGEGAKIAVVEILGSEFDLATVNLKRKRLERDKRRSNDDLEIAGRMKLSLEFVKKQR